MAEDATPKPRSPMPEMPLMHLLNPVHPYAGTTAPTTGRWRIPLFLVLAIGVVTLGGVPSPLPLATTTAAQAAPAVTPAPPAPAPAAPVCPPPSPLVRTNTGGPGKHVALTFDDGPSEYTPAVLDALAAEGVHATFFVLGASAREYPAEVQRAVAAGHIIGNHTWDHRQLPHLSAGQQASEIDDTNLILEALSGKPVCVLRPPYGEHDATTDRLARARGMEVVNWSVDTRDWVGGGAPASSILALAKAGSSQTDPIILMHDGGGNRRNTAAVVREVIRHYRSHGYTFTKVDGSPF